MDKIPFENAVDINPCGAEKGGDNGKVNVSCHLVGVRACNLASVENGGLDLIARLRGKADTQRIAVIDRVAAGQGVSAPRHSERRPVSHSVFERVGNFGR